MRGGRSHAAPVPAGEARLSLRRDRIRQRRPVRERAAPCYRGDPVPRLRHGAAAGQHLLMAPAALLAKVAGTAWGLAAARLLTVGADTVNVILLGVLVRHRGPLTVCVACGGYAVYPDAIVAAHTLLLEPWLNLFCLAGAVLLFDGDRMRGARYRVPAGVRRRAVRVRRRGQDLGACPAWHRRAAGGCRTAPRAPTGGGACRGRRGWPWRAAAAVRGPGTWRDGARRPHRPGGQERQAAAGRSGGSRTWRGCTCCPRASPRGGFSWRSEPRRGRSRPRTWPRDDRYPRLRPTHSAARSP